MAGACSQGLHRVMAREKGPVPEEMVGSQPQGDVASLWENPVVKELLAAALRGCVERMCVRKGKRG